jgi:prolyl oligopeptidase
METLKNRAILPAAVFLLLVRSAAPLAAANSVEPPMTRIEDVTDDLHGMKITDPYRWLEDGSSAEVRAWTEAQNGYTRTVLDARPGREATRARLAQLLSIGTLTAPVPKGSRYFYTRREGEQNQPILYVRDSLKGKDRVLVDPNTLSADGTAALDWWYPSEDGSLLAYGVSISGDEKSTLRVLDVKTGKPLKDVIPNTRYCTLGWLKDRTGFYYTRYPAPGEVPAGQENYNRHVFFHRLGSDWTKDPKVFGEKRKPEEIIELKVSPDGGTMVVWVLEGWSRSDLYLKDLKSEAAPFVPVAEGIDALFQGEVVDGTLYLLTNWEAPRYRLYAVDPRNPARAGWKPLIPQTDAVLSEVHIVGGQLVALYLRDAASRLAVFSASGKKVRDIALPTLGTIDGVDGRYDGQEAFFAFSSYTVPPSVYRYDVKTGTVSLWEQVKSNLDLSGLDVNQVFYPSKDGTRVPMFMVQRKGLRLDGNNPTVLYGYGGFNISLTPAFSRAVVLWLERGGIYAVANLRGGGEYGEDWHRAGMLERKQNVFDDFLAAASWLVDQKYTRPDRLAIYGGSNGGLLVGAALTQKPDLFRAVVCAVPLLDMLRYENFQIAKLWVPEYGSVADEKQFQFLRAYSPYQNVKDATPYPAVLLEAAESDSRVDPMHARKMAARLQKATSSKQPILLRLETRAGHGIGKPLTKLIDEATDTWTFLLWQLGLETR